MRYISTRGAAPVLGFQEVVLTGLAIDGGLYVPESVPLFDAKKWRSLAGLSYPELALEIIRPFTGGEIEEPVLKRLLGEAYAPFRDPAIAPLKRLSADHYLLELFHGPTLAFKDFALQFLGPLLDHILTERDSRAVIVGATSGDTGSAAIAGCRGRERMEIFILHPEGRVSEVQRRQMTSVADANVHNLAIGGTFDDCQDLVKALFADEAFRTRHRLTAVNSINWARILAQVVYYAYAALRLGAMERAVSFSVPTGNFGDIFAGYIAKQMGLPIHRLIVATNRNDILARCIRTGIYGMQGVHPSLSPSMDIEVSSNFERFLFDAYGRDGKKLARMMEDFRREKHLTLSPEAWEKLKWHFDACRIDDTQTTEVIRRIHAATGELLDPHSAVGVGAAEAVKPDGITVTLATAHPAKFPEAVERATGIHPVLPAHMAGLFDLPECFKRLPNDVERVKTYIEQVRSSQG